MVEETSKVNQIEPEEPSTGYEGEMYGLGAEEIAWYTPTRYELFQLVKSWYRELLQIDWLWFVASHLVAYERKVEYLAKSRIDRAARAIGEGAVKKAFKMARDEFKAEVNDARLWEIFEKRDPKQWEAVAEVRQLWDNAESWEDLIALVYRADARDESSPVLISLTETKLNAVLQASGQFEILTDRAKAKASMQDRHFHDMGLLRATRRNGELLFEFPLSSPDTIEWHFLEGVTDQIKKLLHADTGIESQPV